MNTVINLDEFNFKNVCRLCLESKELTDIFNNSYFENQKTSLSFKIMACVSIKVLPTDRGPCKICKKCISNINQWFEFRETCRAANDILEKFIYEFTERKHRASISKKAAEKSNELNDSLLLPEISLFSYDSLLDRSMSVGSNISSILNFSFNSEKTSPDKFSVNSINFSNGTKIHELPKLNVNSAETLTKNDKNFQEIKTKRKSYSCEYCNCSFPRFSKLLTHDESVHSTNIREHSCSVCGHVFAFADRLKIHSEFAHRKKEYKCNECPKLFVSEKSLSVHLRLHNENYKCELCGYLSTSRQYLSQHMQKHNGVAVYFQCKICKGNFSQKSSLLRHENLHLKHRGKFFKCSICGTLNRSQSEVIEHMKVHKSNETLDCKICGKIFKSKKALSVHQQRHESALKYQCIICEKRLFSKYELRAHEETHSDSKKYECFHCDKKFSFKNTLMRHVKKNFPRVPADVKLIR